ncbi:MAG TPA: non-heme iron oxygenase ferredoxin subunit [Candidatus Obscuribacterales bacterium]
MTEFVKVARVSDVPAGGAKLVEANGQKIALFNVDGQLHAIGDSCTHKGGPLSDGFIEGTQVQCPWHGAKFDIKSGQNLTPPAASPVPSYPVEVRDGDVYVQLPS